MSKESNALGTKIHEELEASLKPKQKRGFAVISPERLRAISSLGGTAAHVKGVAHEWSREEAAEAGRKGGRAAHARRGA